MLVGSCCSVDDGEPGITIRVKSVVDDSDGGFGVEGVDTPFLWPCTDDGVLWWPFVKPRNVTERCPLNHSQVKRNRFLAHSQRSFEMTFMMQRQWPHSNWHTESIQFAVFLIGRPINTRRWRWFSEALPGRLVGSCVGIVPEAAASDRILFIRLLLTMGVPLLDVFVVLMAFSVFVLWSTSSSSRKSRVSSRNRCTVSVN